MCRATTCRICGKTTWAGCGQHVATVKMSVPASDWCDGTHRQTEVDEATADEPGGFFSRLFGR